jgi:hypothetical protein
VVEEDVWRVSWSVVAGIAGIVAAITGVVAVIMTRKQVQLAQEEAALRPKLVLSWKTVAWHHRPTDPGYPHAGIVFNVTNDGRSAAHNVHCEIRLDERQLIPDDNPMFGQNHPFFTEHLGPSATKQYQINAAVLAHGWTKAHYRCVCDEVGESEDTVTFKVPEWTPDGN